MKKAGMLTSALQLQCPKCRKADLFYFPILKFKKMYTMKSTCSYCGQNFNLEPGFYYGAMFISYIISSFFMLISFFVIKFAFQLSTWRTFGIVLLLVALVYFYIFRFSRSIWIHFFVDYDENAKNIQ